jgi:hypothetical protein
LRAFAVAAVIGSICSRPFSWLDGSIEKKEENDARQLIIVKPGKEGQPFSSLTVLPSDHGTNHAQLVLVDFDFSSY